MRDRARRGDVMTTTVDRQIDGHLTSKTDAFIDRLAEKLGGVASARAVYGEPVERDGVTVIPVAKVRWGFGGGDGNSEQGSGSGGGGGVLASPIGYIELRDGAAEFRPIKDPVSEMLATLPLVFAGGIVAGIVLGGLRKLIRGK
jgi:uncharacterized spore protein YtfJ